ncbi:uncharacterized protein LOC136065859 [Quercus suber]|uniref:uncharacterized protein LOC136065859 n=1 Tax=Quercus suber TaxID=58331 RepID=UPI0032DEF4C4
MASKEAEKKQEEQQGASYTYWVRQVKEGDAAPLPVPRKLTPDDIINDSNSQPPALGSLWNKAGTWEEKNLNKWASDRIKELLISVGSLEFPVGKAEISDVSKCVGDVSFSSILYLYQLYGFLELEIYWASVISMF